MIFSSSSHFRSSWQSTPAQTVNSLYDGSGNRVAMQSTVSGTTTLTSYIGSIEEVQTSGSTTQTTTYYAVGGKRVAADVNGTFYYFGYDALGSQVAVLNTTGSLVGAQLYGPYGSSRYSTGTLPTSIGFTGQRGDSVTGLDYYNARYYDPSVGQFLSADSVQGNAQGMDPYAYVGGNPETRTDPTGHRDWGGGGDGGEGTGTGGGETPGAPTPGGTGGGSTTQPTPTQTSGGSTTSRKKRLSPDELDWWCGGNERCRNAREVYYDGVDAQGTFNGIQIGLMFAAFFEGMDPEEAQQLIEEDTLSLEYGLGNGEVDDAIREKLQSSNPGEVAEGQAAGIANKYSQLTKFNYKYGPNGSLGEVDVETPEAVIEAKSGRVKIPTLMKQFNNPYTNPDRKPFVIYGPNWGSQEAMTIYENLGSIDTGQNIYVVTNEVQLIEVLQYLQEK